MEMVVIFWPDIYLYIDLFALSWRRSVESNWRNSGQIHGQVFHGRCRPLFKIFPVKREIRKRYSVVEPHHTMHISRKVRVRKSEVSGKRTNSIYMQMRSSFISSMSNRWTLVEILSWLQFRLRCTMNEPRDIGISKRCINNINNEMRILSLPRWLLRFDLDNSGGS